MKKLIFALFLSVCAPLTLCFSQPANETQDLKIITVTQMNLYGRMLFDRKDYERSARVFERVLAYDAQNALAQEYLKKISAKGYAVLIPVALPAKVKVSQEKACVAKQCPMLKMKEQPKVVVEPEQTVAAPLHLDESIPQEEATSPAQPSLLENLNLLEQDLSRMRQSLHEQTLTLTTLEQQLP